MAAEGLGSIECTKAQPLGLAFALESNILAVGCVDGSLEVHDYSSKLVHSSTTNTNTNTNTTNTLVHRFEDAHLNHSARCVLYSEMNELVSAGSDGLLNIYNSETQELVWQSIQNTASSYSKKTPINCIAHLPNHNNLIVSGDDVGGVKLWDLRTKRECVQSYDDIHSDFISSFTWHDQSLLTTSGDCTLGVIDLRSKKEFKRSDDQEDELLSCTVIKGGKKVVCGTQMGVINVWSWNTWGDISDRFPGHPQSVDAMLKVDEDTILTGSSDGLIRIVQIHPDQLLGVFGDHEGFPIEEMRYSHDKKVIGSLSHDQHVRLWDASILWDDDNDDDEGEMDEGDDDVLKAVQEKIKQSSTTMKGNSDDEWSDVDSDDGGDGMDDSDDDDSDDGKKGGKKKFMTENERFFQDL